VPNEVTPDVVQTVVAGDDAIGEALLVETNGEVRKWREPARTDIATKEFEGAADIALARPVQGGRIMGMMKMEGF
jgi:hypothetical protein